MILYMKLIPEDKKNWPASDPAAAQLSLPITNGRNAS